MSENESNLLVKKLESEFGSTHNRGEAFSFGIIGDTQYVDADNGATHDGSVVRRYRQSLWALREACLSFNEYGVSCCILLGDILDGKCVSMGSAERCLQEIFDITKLSNSTWHYCIGNHDLMCFTREELNRKLTPKAIRTVRAPSQLHYDFSPHRGYRFIFLDGYEVSTLNASSNKNAATAQALLLSKNPNLSIKDGSWFKGLSPENCKYVPFNGGLSDEQLVWFDKALKSSTGCNERCFVFSHMPCYPPCCRSNGLMWSCDEVTRIMHKYPGTVAAFIAGHDHDGGYALDAAGIHHIVPPSPLECDVDELAHGHVTVHDATSTSPPYFELHWTGKVPKSALKSLWPTKMDFAKTP
jgi:manganese-dependent ADP-ribose/CDP-alcohol diphosphatase